MNLYPWLQNVGSFLLLLGAFGVEIPYVRVGA